MFRFPLGSAKQSWLLAAAQEAPKVPKGIELPVSLLFCGQVVCVQKLVRVALVQLTTKSGGPSSRHWLRILEK